MSLRLQFVANQQLEHQENQMQGERDEHRFVMDISVSFQSRMRMSPPDVTAYGGTHDNHAFPKPYRTEDCPPAPLDVIVQTQSKEDRENHEAGVKKKFAEKKQIFSWNLVGKSCFPWFWRKFENFVICFYLFCRYTSKKFWIFGEKNVDAGEWNFRKM